MAVIEPVTWTGDIYGGPEEYEASLRPFSKAQRLIWAISWYQSEVFNGGHDQFFDNSTGIVWRDALTALKEIGAAEVAAILEEAGRRLGQAPSMDRDERQEQVSAFYKQGGSFNDLDAAFYGSTRTYDLRALVMAYIRAHASEFYFDGIVKRPPPR